MGAHNNEDEEHMLQTPRSSMSSILDNVSGKDRELLEGDFNEHDNYDQDDYAKHVNQHSSGGRVKSSKKKVYIFIGGAVVILLLTLGLVFSQHQDRFKRPDGKQLTLNDMRHGEYQPHRQRISWTDTGNNNTEGQYLVNAGGTWYTKQWGSDEKNIILKNPFIKYNQETYTVESVLLNHQQDKAIVATDVEHNWRYSTFAKYWILDIESGKTEPVYVDKPDDKLSLAKWSPRGDRIAFINKNNLFLRHVGGVNDTKVSQITKDGGEEIFYGRPDWVYEEEVLQNPEALWWSRSGEYLAFLRTNDTQVQTYPVQYFVPDSGLRQYPEVVDIKYPKPGSANPIVNILFLEVETEEYYSVSTEDEPVEDDLVTEVVWAGDNQVIVRMTNRESDLFKLSLVNAQTRQGRIVRKEELNKDDGWFEVTKDLTYVPKDVSNGRPEDGYIDTIVHNGYDHMAYFSPLDSNEPKKMLTSGDWEVVSAPSAIDLKTNTVYFISTKKSPIERHLYSVKLDGSKLTPITDDQRDGYFDASFSSDARFALLDYEGPDIPYQKVIDLHSERPFEQGDVIENNAKLAERLENYAYPQVVYQQVPLYNKDNNGTTFANAVEFLPPNFDKHRKYPVLFHVYGGPMSQTVEKKFKVDFQKILTSYGIIVVIVDGRGTGKMGRKFRSVVRDHLGRYEVEDQITAAKNWASRTYIDKDRIGIWGWSYGGFMTLKTLETDAGNTFKYGMAVAPVTDWRYYDSIYTERYMHTPEHNQQGYEQSKVSNVTALGENERFLVMHGTGDDNVHFQNTLVLLDDLNKGEVENFDMMAFPDSDHSIYRHNANTIVYDKLESWIKKEYGVEDD